MSRLSELTKTDYVALAVGAGLFAYLFYAATVSFIAVDEGLYYSIVQRQLDGDRLLIDEWHVSQLSSVLQLLPYWLFTSVIGSTEGVLLSLRFLFVCVHLTVCCFVYVRLRKYGWCGLLSVLLYAVYIPNQLMTLNYYMMALHGWIVICTVLFVGKEKKNAAVLVLMGMVLACTVLAEPFSVAIYFIWCLLLLCRIIAEKQNKPFLSAYGFILDVRIWFFMTIGVVCVAAVFFAYLLIRSPLTEIIKSVPELFTDFEYSFDEKGRNLLSSSEYGHLLQFFGYAPPIGGTVLIFVAAALKKKGVLHTVKQRGLLLSAACLCLIGAYLCGTFRVIFKNNLLQLHGETPSFLYYLYYLQAPLLLFGLFCYILCDHKDRRLFCFWIVGMLASVAVDLASDITIGLGGAIALPEAVVCFVTLIKELCAEAAINKPAADKKEPVRFLSDRFFTRVAALTLCAVIVWEAFGLYSYGFYHVEELCGVLDNDISYVRITRGPLKGIKTTARVGGIYEELLSDLDVIKANTDGPVYVTQLFSYLYLYMDLPIGSYSTSYVEEDSEVRQCRYWGLHPERLPTYIYIPFYDSYAYLSYRKNEETARWGEEKIRFLQTLCDCEVTEGKAGFILRVVRWDTGAVAAVSKGRNIEA